MQGLDRFQFLGVMELFLAKFSNMFFIGNFLTWREVLRSTGRRSLARCLSSTGLLNVVEVKKCFACTLEVVIDQESAVVLCLLLFHVESPLETSGQQLVESTCNFLIKYLEVWNNSSQYRTRPLQFIYSWRNRCHTPWLLLKKLELEQTNFALEIHLPNYQ